MKFTAAALLAIGAVAVQLKQDTTDVVATSGDPNQEFAPDCGAVPEFPENVTDRQIFEMIAGEDMHIDAAEAKHALYCAAQWDLITMEEAMWAYEDGLIAAGNDGKLSLEDAGLA